MISPDDDTFSIIVRMPNWLGDAVMALPLLDDIKERLSKIKITALCQSGVADLCAAQPAVDHIIRFEKKKRCDVICKLRSQKFDCGLLLPNSFSSAWMFFRGGVKRRIGYTGNMRSVLLNKMIVPSAKRKFQHLVITYKQLLEPLGIRVSDTNPRLFVTDEERAAAKQQLQEYGIFDDAFIVGFNTSAAYGSAKCWLPERFHAVARKVQEELDGYVLFFGDRASYDGIEAISSGLSRERTFNVAGQTTIREFLALTQQCSTFLTNDSGPMHIAAALQVPVVALFGSTDPQVTGPYGCGTIVRHTVPCSPCFLRECPTDFQCMKSIGVDEVYRELKKHVSYPRE